MITTMINTVHDIEQPTASQPASRAQGVNGVQHLPPISTPFANNAAAAPPRQIRRSP
jgi:hypothetical protein